MSFALALSAVLLAAFVLVGALDLGVGILLLLVARGRDRDAVLALGGRPWSAGAIWTLIAFALLVAGLPASLVSLRALWPAVAVILFALTLRGFVAALRPHVLRQDLCDLLFGLASLLAAGCQGLALGWFMGGLSSALPARHAGPLGSLSIWGVLCAAGLVGLYASLGAGWLNWSGRGAVRVFGREVGHAAAILTAGALTLCAIWAVPTGVASHAFVRGWEAALLGSATMVLLVPFALSLWGRHPALPQACAVGASLCGLAAAAVLLRATALPGAASGDVSVAGYLAFILLFGSPPLVVDIVRRRAALFWADLRSPVEAPSYAGRRCGSLANHLHMS